MAIKKGSRYEYSTIDFFSLANNAPQVPVVFYEFPGESYIEYQIHYTLEKERLDQIAYKYYARPEMWWKLMDYNPEVTDPINIPAGTALRIPLV